MKQPTHLLDGASACGTASASAAAAFGTSAGRRSFPSAPRSRLNDLQATIRDGRPLNAEALLRLLHSDDSSDDGDPIVELPKLEASCPCVRASPGSRAGQELELLLSNPLTLQQRCRSPSNGTRRLGSSMGPPGRVEAARHCMSALALSRSDPVLHTQSAMGSRGVVAAAKRTSVHARRKQPGLLQGQQKLRMGASGATCATTSAVYRGEASAGLRISSDAATTSPAASVASPKRAADDIAQLNPQLARAAALEKRRKERSCCTYQSTAATDRQEPATAETLRPDRTRSESTAPVPFDRRPDDNSQQLARAAALEQRRREARKHRISMASGGCDSNITLPELLARRRAAKQRKQRPPTPEDAVHDPTPSWDGPKYGDTLQELLMSVDPTGYSAGTLSPRIMKAAAAFDEGLREQTGCAERHLEALGKSHCKGQHFTASIEAVRRLRPAYEPATATATTIFVPEPASTAQTDRKAKSTWRLSHSIWTPRRRWAESGAFFDTEKYNRQVLETDWYAALQARGTVKLMVKHNTTSMTATSNSRRRSMPFEATDDLVNDAELREVMDVLWSHFDLVYALFDYYAAQSEYNVVSITLHAFMLFVKDGDLINPSSDSGCQPQHFEQMFVAVNAGASKLKYKHKRALCRRDFLQILVRIAIAKFGMLGPVTTALDALLEQLRSLLASTVAHNANDFRRDHCYIEQTDLVLRKHEASLRALFDVYAHGSGAVGDPLQASHLLGYQQWMDLLRDTQLFDPTFTRREGCLCFVWCRFLVADEMADKQRAKMFQLSFEDFCEALLRVAAQKALPTDNDLDVAGFSSSVDFMAAICGDSARKQRFFSERSCRWGAELHQPVWRAFDHLMSQMIHMVDPVSSSDGKGLTSKAIMSLKRHSPGILVKMGAARNLLEMAAPPDADRE